MNEGKGAMEYSLFVAGQNRNTFSASEFRNFISIFKTNFVAKVKHFAFMDKQSYPFREIKNELLFEFDSISESQTIRKVISYQRIDTKRNIFNLALLDLDDDGNMSDTVVSNNADMEKVLATVVQTLPIFFEKVENAKVFFTGSTPARTRLYRMIISKFLDEFKRNYTIFGFVGNTPVLYEKGKSYEAFMIKKTI